MSGPIIIRHSVLSAHNKTAFGTAVSASRRASLTTSGSTLNFTYMKTIKSFYEAPCTKILVVNVQGVLCSSFTENGESIGDQKDWDGAYGWE